MKLILHTDGAAKGNPGPAGIGVALYTDGNVAEPIGVIAEPIEDTTNNVAEYRALLRGLSEALLRGADEVEVRTDSELMARQIAGQYKVTAIGVMSVELTRVADGVVVRLALKP